LRQTTGESKLNYCGKFTISVRGDHCDPPRTPEKPSNATAAIKDLGNAEKSKTPGEKTQQNYTLLQQTWKGKFDLRIVEEKTRLLTSEKQRIVPQDRTNLTLFVCNKLLSLSDITHQKKKRELSNTYNSCYVLTVRVS